MLQEASLDRGVAPEPRHHVGDFEEFFHAHFGPVLSALYLVTGDRMSAEDLAQEAFARIYERWDAIRASGNPAGYAYRIALNQHRSALRRRRSVFVAPSPEDDAERRVDERDLLKRALATLSRKERVAVVLVDWLGVTVADAAGILRTSSGAIRTRRSRAHARLRAELGGIRDA